MEATHITSNPKSWKLGTVKDDDDDDYDDGWIGGFNMRPTPHLRVSLIMKVMAFFHF